MLPQAAVLQVVVVVGCLKELHKGHAGYSRQRQGHLMACRLKCCGLVCVHSSQRPTIFERRIGRGRMGGRQAPRSETGSGRGRTGENRTTGVMILNPLIIAMEPIDVHT